MPPKRRRSGKLKLSNVMVCEPPFVPTTLPRLIELIRQHIKTPFKDCQELPPILESLENINALFGMGLVKHMVVDQVLHFAQRHRFAKPGMGHIVIRGPPGCGKTTLATLLAQLYNHMGRIATNQVVVGNRRNMIGSYVGHTAKMTQAVIDTAEGGVLLIDEAYSLGGTKGDDTFSKTCIDTLNENLSNPDKKFICIVVGYQDQLQQNFFGINEGLKRRFRWWFTLTAYTPAELAQIFVTMVAEKDLQLETNVVPFFEKYSHRFIHHASSVQELVDKTQLVHCRRVFGKTQKGCLSIADMEQALQFLPKKALVQTHTSMYV